jgi:predicted nucleic acid-binding protein
MILYLDASALVKYYAAEPGSAKVMEAISRAELIGTAIITRAEVSAALAKAVRTRALTEAEARSGLQTLREEWPHLMRLEVSETLIARADLLAWDLGLRGYDAVHLAAALAWREAIGAQVTLATFDQQLWAAAERVELTPYPEDVRQRKAQ